MSQVVQTAADKTTVAYPKVALAVIIVLLLLVVYLVLTRKEKFSPTVLSRLQGQDTQGVGWTSLENKERAEGGAAPPSTAAGPKEGSASWKVLHSDDFACDKRDPVGDDAWGWMVGHSRDAETARGGRMTDAEMSAVSAGYNASHAMRKR